MAVQKKYTTYKSHALRFAKPRDGLRLYCKGRETYKSDLTRLALAVVDTLQALGVNVDIFIK